MQPPDIAPLLPPQPTKTTTYHKAICGIHRDPGTVQSSLVFLVGDEQHVYPVSEKALHQLAEQALGGLKIAHHLPADASA